MDTRLFVDYSGDLTSSSTESDLQERKKLLKELNIELLKQNKRTTYIAIVSAILAAAALVVSIFKD